MRRHPSLAESSLKKRNRLLALSMRELAAIFLGAAGFFFAFPNPMGQIPLTALLLPIVLLFFATSAPSRGKAAFNSFLSYTIGSAFGLYWLTTPMLDFASVPMAVALLFVLLLGAYFGVYAAVYAVLSRCFLRSLPLPVALVASAVTWAALELLRSWVGTGFPWLYMSSALTGWPLWAQFNAILGVYGLSALFWLIGLALGTTLLPRQAWSTLYACLRNTVKSDSPEQAEPVNDAEKSGEEGRSTPARSQRKSNSATDVAPVAAKRVQHQKEIGGALPESTKTAEKKHGDWQLRAVNTAENAAPPCLLPRRVCYAALALCLLTAFPAFGMWRMQRMDALTAEAPKAVVGLTQGNITQGVKFAEDMHAATLDIYLGLSRRTITLAQERFGQKPDIILWPETAVPFFPDINPSQASRINEFARKYAVPLLFGLPGRVYTPVKDAPPEKPYDIDDYNRVMLLGPDGFELGTYDKEQLVPFGESIPKGIYIPYASEFLQGFGFSRGKNSGPLVTGPFALGPLICYEVAFTELAQRRADYGANLLVTVSNDAWFGKSAGPVQHLQLAAQRCIEQGRYMARATNTGITAVIDASGRIINPGPLFARYAAAEQVALLTGRTWYNIWYDWIIGILAVSPAVFLVLAALWNRKNILCDN